MVVYVGLMLFLVWTLFISTKTWWFKQGVIAPLIGRFISQVKARKNGEEPIYAEDNIDPLRTKPVPNLLMADLFLFVGLPWTFYGLVFPISSLMTAHSVQFSSEHGELINKVVSTVSFIIRLMLFHQ